MNPFIIIAANKLLVKLLISKEEQPWSWGMVALRTFNLRPLKLTFSIFVNR
jgi:hypothetical protein